MQLGAEHIFDCVVGQSPLCHWFPLCGAQLVDDTPDMTVRHRLLDLQYLGHPESITRRSMPCCVLSGLVQKRLVRTRLFAVRQHCSTIAIMLLLLHIIAVLLAGHTALAAVISTTEPTVTLDSGTFVGTLDGTTNKFLGIPFAKPP